MLCQRQKELSDEIAIAFMKKMYDPEIEKSDFYWIAGDPTGTAEIYDTYWSLGNMYEVLDKDYPKEDVWNWYNYTTENCDDKVGHCNLDYFCNVYKGYKGKLSDIYEREVESRNKNTAYWNSPEGKAETDRIFNEATDNFIKDLGTSQNETSHQIV